MLPALHIVPVLHRAAGTARPAAADDFTASSRIRRIRKGQVAEQWQTGWITQRNGVVMPAPGASLEGVQAYLGRWGLAQPQPTRYTSCSSSRYTVQTGEADL